jgi:hypothetical protein
MQNAAILEERFEVCVCVLMVLVFLSAQSHGEQGCMSGCQHLFFSAAVCNYRLAAFHIAGGRLRSSELQPFLSLHRSLTSSGLIV